MVKVPKVLQSIALLLCVPVKRQKHRRVRMMMRGYRYLKSAGRLCIIEDTIQHLREFQLQIPCQTLPDFLWGQALHSAELVVRQRLSSRYSQLVRALLIASSAPLGKVIAPFPKPWLVELQQLGFRIDYFRSSVLWYLYLAKCLCYAVFKGIIVIKDFFVTRRAPVNTDSYIYFSDLSANNIPSASNDTLSNCILSWYTRWPERRRDIRNLRHSVPYSSSQQIGPYCLRYQPAPVLALTSRKKQLAFILSFVGSLFCQSVSILKCHWWNLLLYHEFITSLQVRLQSMPIAEEYWFHNSRIYPPLWVYELPALGSKCIYYFYSTNIEPFVFRDDASLPLISPYAIMNWPEYLVWDKHQYSFVKLCHADCSNIRIVGPIAFSDYADCNSSYINALPSLAIAVFDVQPFRASMYQSFGFASEFYVPDQSIDFFSDIVSCAVELNVKLLIKRKREIGNESHPRYRKFFASLSSYDNIILVDPRVSAYSLVRYSIGSVSMPYTSTAIVFSEADVSSVYYAPMTARRVSSSPSHGIPLVRGVENLRLWMRGLIIAKTPPGSALPGAV